MDNKEGKREIELKLIRIQETGFYINTEELSKIGEIQEADLNIKLGFKIELQLENDLFILHLRVNYNYKKDGVNLEILELLIANSFKIKSLNKLVSISDNEFKDNAGILPTLMGIAIGTLRGILFTKTIGTVLGDYPLPIMNPTEICNKKKIENAGGVE